MSIHTILSQMEESFDKEFTDEGQVNANTLPRIKEWLSTFATRIAEEVGKELIGEDEYELNTWESPEVIERNLFRKSMRTKLQKMKGEV